jgi:hypothetical protein
LYYPGSILGYTFPEKCPVITFEPKRQLGSGFIENVVVVVDPNTRVGFE